MKIQRIKLRGFIGIKKGMGLDEIELDLSSLSGLIAFSGSNGNGKSTLMENMHPFRTLASRKGALQHHVFLRDSVKELDFIMNGDHYRTVIKIDNHSGRQEGFIYKNGSESSLVDGKLPEYDKAIKKLFGSQNLFFNSVFCAQNSDKISDLTTGQLKTLFAEFLRLDKLQDYESTSKQALGILAGKKETNTDLINKLTEKIENIGNVDTDIQKKKNDKDEWEKLIPELQQKVEKMEADLETERKIVNENEVAEKRITDLHKQIEIINIDITNDQETSKIELTGLRDKISELTDEISETEKLLENKDEIIKASDRIKEIEIQIQSFDNLLSRNRKLKEDLSNQIKEVEKQSLEATQKGVDERSDLIGIRDNSMSEYNRILEDIQKCSDIIEGFRDNAELKLLEQNFENCKNQITVLEKRDPACISETCSFIKIAIEAKENLPDIEKQLVEMNEKIISETDKAQRDTDELKSRKAIFEDQFKKMNDELKAFDNNVKGYLDAFDEKISELESEYTSVMEKLELDEISYEALKTEKSTTALLADKENEIIVAETNLKNIISRKEELDNELPKLEQVYKDREQNNKNKIKGIDNQIILIKSEVDENAAKRMRDIHETISFLENQIGDFEKMISIADSDLNRLHKLAEDKIELTNEKDILSEKQNVFNKEITSWTYLKNACSKDGLQALEIDSVAPGVAGNANSLLTTAFGPLSTVDFRTLDDEGRETLEIRVIDEEGEEVLLSNRSGGQKVWVLKALRLAMTMISKEKSGRDFQSLLADEEDGALDVENAKRFVSLYRAIMAKGDFNTCFYISHEPECVAMADHEIKFTDKGIICQ